MVETRVAILSIMVEQPNEATQINALLHEFSEYIVGRMGLPYRERGVSVICVVIDAPQTAISTLSGKIGRLPGVSAKTLYTKAS